MKKNIFKSVFLFSKNDTIKDKLIVILSWVFVAILLGCIIQLSIIFYNYYKSDADQKTIVDMAVTVPDTTPVKPDKSDDTTSEAPQPTPIVPTKLEIDFDKLLSTNPDTVGWLYLDGSKINYPVVQCEDNDKYLHTNFYGEYHSLGTLFADFRADTNSQTQSDNITLYGHNAKNGSFFAGLLKYKSVDYYNANRFIDWYTPDNPEGDRYIVIAAFLANATAGAADNTHYNDFINASEEADFNSFINQAQYKNYVNNNIDVKYGDKLLTFSTCDYVFDNARFVLVARKAREGEMVEDLG